MLPRLNRRRALFVLTKIDEILCWEQQKDAERDTRFVELGRYLCEVRAGQYWRLENLKSFDEFLEKRFPESRRKAYYLMSIHEHLPPQARRELKEVGWTKGLERARTRVTQNCYCNPSQGSSSSSRASRRSHSCHKPISGLHKYDQTKTSAAAASSPILRAALSRSLAKGRLEMSILRQSEQSS